MQTAWLAASGREAMFTRRANMRGHFMFALVATSAVVAAGVVVATGIHMSLMVFAAPTAQAAPRPDPPVTPLLFGGD
jgi:hypothetical protein